MPPRQAKDAESASVTADPDALPEAGRRTASDEEFDFERLSSQPELLGIDRHVLAGAAAFHGWTPGTQLSKADVKEGVTEFLNHKPNEEA